MASIRVYHPVKEPLTPSSGKSDELKALRANEWDWTLPGLLLGLLLRCIGLQVVPAYSGSCCRRYGSVTADGFDLAAMLEWVATKWALCIPRAPTEGMVHLFMNMCLIPSVGSTQSLPRCVWVDRGQDRAHSIWLSLS